MFVDRIRNQVWENIRQRDFRTFDPWLTRQVFEEAALRAGVCLGGGPLCLVVLVWLGIAAAVHRDKSFAQVLGLALKLMRDDERWSPAAVLSIPHDQPASPTPKKCRRSQAKGKKTQAQKTTTRPRSPHDPRGHGDPFRVSPAAFTQARQAMPWSFWVALVVVLSERFAAQQPDAAGFHGFRLLAWDGTKLEWDRWSDLRRRAGAAAKGKALSAPRARLVLLELALVRLPLRFDLVPYGVGERTAAAPLLDVVRRHDLLLMDRGFWSYGLFGQIQQRGADFAIRLISGVKCRTLRSLGPDDRWARWTPTQAQRDGAVAGAPSLELRLIDYQIKGFRPSTLVTSVLDPERISREDWIRLAEVDRAGRVLAPAGLYHRRWEIETTFLELKETQGMAGSFRSRTTEGIAYEVGGHLLLYTLVRLWMAQTAAGLGISPLRLSFRGALEEIKDLGGSLRVSSPEHVERVLRPRLRERIGSHRVPFRPNRHFPRPQDTKAKTDRHGTKQPPHKQSPTIRSIVMKEPSSQNDDASGLRAAG
jgi:DDE family transposase